MAGAERLPLRVRLIEGLIEDEQLVPAESQLSELDAAIRYLTTNDGENQRDWVVASRDLLWAKLHIQGHMAGLGVFLNVGQPLLRCSV